jgi:hypothetical protein
MLSYVVVATKAGGELPPQVVQALDEPQPAELFFQATERLVWRNERGTLGFFGWQAAAEAGGIRSHWHPENGRLTAFSGHLWPAGGWNPGQGWAAQLAALYADSDPEESVEGFFGCYSVVSLGAEGGIVMPDSFGACPLYWAETDEVFVLSNRAVLTARAVTGDGLSAPRSASGLAWLPYFGSIVGNETSLEDVSTLGVGECVRFDPVGRPSLRRTPIPLWRLDADGGRASRDRDELIEAVLADLVGNVRGMAALETPRKVLRLSGGKDSRLVLALILIAGVQDQFSLRTVGLPGFPDVVIASQVAQRAEVELAVQQPTEAVMTPDEFDERVRTHVFQSSGMLGAFTLRGGLGSTRDLVLSGLFGEVMRSNYAARHSTRTVEELEAFFDRVLHFNSAGLMQDDARVAYRQVVRDWVARLLAAGEDPENVPDVFWLYHRMHRWFGTAQELNGMSPQGFPLQSLVATRTAFALGHRARQIEALHFELLRRAWEPFMKLPFANAQWHPENYAHLPDADEYEAIAPYRGETGAPPRWQEANWESNMRVVADYLSARTNPIYEVLDRRRVLEAVEGRRELSIHGKEQLYGALAAAIWLGRQERPARIPAPPDQVRVA